MLGCFFTGKVCYLDAVSIGDDVVDDLEDEGRFTDTWLSCEQVGCSLHDLILEDSSDLGCRAGP